jgi:iron complex transport system substrate-binding protein
MHFRRRHKLSNLQGARVATRARHSTVCVLAFAACWVVGFASAQHAVAAENSRPQRIVSLSPHATELLFAAGAGGSVVGVTESCDKPPTVKRLPKVSGFRGTNVEAVVALKPDLVVVWPGGNRSADVDALRRFGIPVHSSELATLASITSELRLFSEWATNADLRNAALARAYEADRLTQALRGRYAALRKVKVFYQLGAGRLFTLTDKHVVGEALAICGAENIFGKLVLPAPEVSTEAVLGARPDAVLVASKDALIAVRSDWQARQLFSATTAVERIVAVDGAQLHRPTLGTFEAVRSMCEAIDQVRQTLR